ncbi:MAG: flagellar brake protein [Clostridiales bacterium]|jgi:c-di-GMP-binding flagellar brake protein YcgR|nr:flagellar brake protein [Clostridiales bacterium]
MFGSIKVGDRLEISLKRDKDTGKAYVSQVEKILGKNQLLAQVPISYGQLVRLSVSDYYSCLFFTESGMLIFDATIMGYITEEGSNFMTLALKTTGEKVQRREFFRFMCLLPIKFSVVQDPGTPGEPSNAIHEGVIKDLGGGGVRFVSNGVISEGAKIKCVVLLNGEYFVAVAKILYKQVFPKSIYKYQYRGMFIGLLPSEQERIVQFIFNEQRKNLRRTGVSQSSNA